MCVCLKVPEADVASNGDSEALSDQFHPETPSLSKTLQRQVCAICHQASGAGVSLHRFPKVVTSSKGNGHVLSKTNYERCLLFCEHICFLL